MLRTFAHLRVFALALLTATLLAAATPAGAVLKGTPSSLGRYTVRLLGNGNCSGVAIARRAVATAGHCAEGMYVVAGGKSFRVAGISRSVVLDDGRQASASGDAAILKLSAPLPASIDTVPIGEGEGETFVIAGYGSGTLREATLVAAEPRALVDPNRAGSISASACFGDSGGPVMRGGMLVGIITRAAHPSPRIACGDLTRWAAITASAAGETVAVAKEDASPAESPLQMRQRQARRVPPAEAAAFNPFGTWFAQRTETRRSMRHKEAKQ
jgi:Trypsin